MSLVTAAPPAGRAIAGVRTGLRLLIGLVLLAAGVSKALDLPGFVRVLGTYGLVPEGALVPVGVAVTLGDLLLGAWLLSGRRLAAAAGCSVALHAGYAALLLGTLARGLDLPNCGCFGVFLARPLTWRSPVEDAVAAGLSWLLLRLAPRETIGAGARTHGSDRGGPAP